VTADASHAGKLAEVVARLLRARGRAALAVREQDLGACAGGTVFVTGAAGSVGAALVGALVQRAGALRVVAFDHDDTGLQRLLRRRSGGAVVPWLGDVRDEAAVRAALAATAPQLVLHCAALKHADLVQRFPREALRTNVLGTACVVGQALAAGARVVNVSSDKAARADSVLGASKRLGERVTAWFARGSSAAASVRLGNVLDSRGAVLEVYLAHAAAGLPLPVTEPAMTRYVSCTGEVVALLLRAAARGGGGRCLVPDLGQPVAVAAIAQCVLDVTGSGAGVRVTGARPGDAMTELLVGEREVVLGTAEDGCREILAPALHPAGAAPLLQLPDEELGAAMVALAHRPAGDGGGEAWAPC